MAKTLKEEPVNKSTAGHTVVRKVRFISRDKRYQRTPYPFTVALSQGSGRYVTAQEHILSESQMRGQEKVTPAQRRLLMMGDNPYIINPDNVYMLQALRTFDLSYEVTGEGDEDRIYLNPRDFAEYSFFMTQEKVAASKEAYQVNQHFFYLEDKEKEAEQQLAKVDLQFEAESFVRGNLPLGRWKEVVMLMNYTVPRFMLDPRAMTENALRKTVLEACREHPNVVLMLASKDNASLVFVLKLLYHKLVERKNSMDFYAGETYIGSTLESVRLFTLNPQNEALVTKWGRTIEQKEA
jgi:hypothetical protein